MGLSDLKSLWTLGAGLLPHLNLVALLDSVTLDSDSLDSQTSNSGPTLLPS